MSSASSSAEDNVVIEKESIRVSTRAKKINLVVGFGVYMELKLNEIFE